MISKAISKKGIGHSSMPLTLSPLVPFSVLIIQQTNDLDCSRDKRRKMATPSSLDLFLADLDEKEGKLPPHEEVCLIQRHVRKAIETILWEVRIENSFYVTTLVNSGSFYEGTKVGKPDEFDFFVQLDALSSSDDIEFHQLPCSTVLVLPREAALKNMRPSFPGYFPHIMNFEWKEDIKTPFFKLFNSKARGFEEDGMKVVQRPEDEAVGEPSSLRRHGPAYSLLLEWNGGEYYKGLRISVDLTLAVKINSRPKVDLQHGSQSGRVVNSLLDRLPYFLAVGSYRDVLSEVRPNFFAESEKQSPGQFQPSKFCLRCSQSCLEQVLFSEEFGPDSGQSKCLRLLKVLRDILFPPYFAETVNTQYFIFPILWKDLEFPLLCSSHSWNDDFKRSVGRVVSSYVLKTLVLFEWQRNPTEDLWSKSNLSRRLINILRDLEDSLKKRHLTSFFYADYNLFRKETPDRYFVDVANMVNTLLKGLESINKIFPQYSFEVCLEKVFTDFEMICRKKRLTSVLSTALKIEVLDDPLFQRVVDKSLRREGKGEIYDSSKTVENEHPAMETRLRQMSMEIPEKDDLVEIYLQSFLDKIAPEETLALTYMKVKNRESLSDAVNLFEKIARRKMEERDNLPSYDLWSQEHWRIEDSDHRLTSDKPKKLLEFLHAVFQEDLQILHDELME